MIKLGLSSHKLNGQIPTQVGLLTSLTSGRVTAVENADFDDFVEYETQLFFLSLNPLTGTAPSEIGMLTGMLDM